MCGLIDIHNSGSSSLPITESLWFSCATPLSTVVRVRPGSGSTSREMSVWGFDVSASATCRPGSQSMINKDATLHIIFKWGDL
jgi:hypothetical protein